MKYIYNSIGRPVLRITAFCCFLLIANPALFAAPQIQVEQPFWNFGAVTNLAGLTHDFVIRNSGDAPLVISHVLSSCSACLQAGIENTNIPAGGTTVVHGRLDMRLLSGAISRAILVDCNDPKTPSFMLELTGWVVPAYQLIPPEISLDLSQGQKSGTMEILPLLGFHAVLCQATCDDTNLAATVYPQPSGKFLLAVRLENETPRGNMVAAVTICSTNSSDLPCRVNVFIHYPPDLELIPAQLRFRPQAERQTRILWVKQHGVAPLQLLDAISPSDKYHCEIEPDPASFDYRIYVTAWQQETLAGQTNSLVLKLAKPPDGKAQSAVVPVLVELP